MAQYLTTGEDLTSIADAIRAASDENSPLVYPTGFVSKIGELSKYTWMGASPTIEWQSSDIILTLADTTLSSWTPSTTAAVIYQPTQINSSQLYLNHDKQYAIVYEIYSNFIYTETPSVPHIQENYYVGAYHFSPRPNSVNNLINNVKDWVTYANSISIFFAIYYDSSGNLSVTNNGYGIYYTNDYPRLSNQNKSEIGCNLYLPYIRASVNNGYMHANAFGLLDLNNSIINIKATLYSTEHNIMSDMNNNIRELYLLNHKIT